MASRIWSRLSRVHSVPGLSRAARGVRYSALTKLRLSVLFKNDFGNIGLSRRDLLGEGYQVWMELKECAHICCFIMTAWASSDESALRGGKGRKVVNTFAYYVTLSDPKKRKSLKKFIESHSLRISAILRLTNKTFCEKCFFRKILTVIYYIFLQYRSKIFLKNNFWLPVRCIP